MSTTIGEALREGSARLRRLDLPSADLEAALLLGQATGLGRLELVTKTARVLDASQRRAYEDLLARRERRMPLQYLTGIQEFMSLSFAVGPAVLVPRPETEHLVEAILDLEEGLGPPEPGSPGRLVADVGTGSGAIAVALASYVTTLRAVATDISKEALDVARANAVHHGVADRIEFRLGSGVRALGDLAGRIDYLVSNPPYVPTALIADLEPEVREWEPRVALDGGPDGLDIIRDLVAGAPDLLPVGGHLAIEMMAGQSEAVMALIAPRPWEHARVIPDYAGHARVVVARRGS